MNDRRQAVLPRRLSWVVGAGTTAALVVYPLSGATVARPRAYLFVVLVGALVAAATGLAPFRSAFRDSAPVHMYVWSAALVLTIAGAVGLSGGASSELHELHMLPLLFAATAYRPAATASLAVLALASTVLAELTAPASLSALSLALHVGVIGIPVYVVTRLTHAKRRALDVTREARGEAHQRAETLTTLAVTATAVNDLDTLTVLRALVVSAQGLGFSGAAIVGFDADTWVCVEASGSLVDRVGARGHVRDDPDLARVREGDDVQDPPSWVGDAPAGRAFPVFVDDRPVGALIAVSEADIGSSQELGLRVLTGQAGNALANARRFEEERQHARRLREFDELKHDLISTTSHELRTPTTVIKAATELLVSRWDQLEERRRRQLVERVHEHVAALELVLDQLSGFIDLESGRLFDLDARPTDARSLADRAVRAVEDQAADHDLEVRAEHVDVVVDSRAIHRVLVALLDNAIRHTPPGTRVRLVIEATPEGVELVVRDDGPGVPPTEIDLLREPFHRGGDVLTRESRGLGLGLTLADRIMTAHEGRLELTSPPTGGFVARAVLPSGALYVGDVSDHPARSVARGLTASTLDTAG